MQIRLRWQKSSKDKWKIINEFERTNSNRYLIIIFILFFALILCSNIVISKTEAFASEGLDLDEADRVLMRYNRAATIDENFEKGRLQVIIKHKYSITYNEKTVVEQILKEANTFDIESIKGWIPIEEIKRNPLWNEKSFHQILDVYLNNSKQSKENVLQAIAELSKSDMVLSALPYYNYVVVEDWEPNDLDYSSQWGLHGTQGINAPQAWNIIHGNNAVKVGLFEAGAQKDHEDLDGLFLQENFITDDSDDHGTHVAGIIGAISNNGTGISGIANVQFLLLDRSNFTDSITHAANNNVWVINASYQYEVDGSYAPYNAVHAAAITNYSGLIVCVAGNEGNNTNNTRPYPSGYSNFSNVISVGSLNQDGTRCSDSNYGSSSVSLFAPGDAIYSTVPTNRYELKGGTSMATPFVTGTAALMLALIESKPHDMTPDQISALIKSTIISSVDLHSSLSGYCVSGGYLNAYDALHDLSLTKQAFSDFGYNGSTYYWNGKVDMTVDMAYLCDANSSNTIVFNGNTALDFVLETVSSSNAFSQINGTVSF